MNRKSILRPCCHCLLVLFLLAIIAALPTPGSAQGRTNVGPGVGLTHRDPLHRAFLPKPSVRSPNTSTASAWITGALEKVNTNAMPGTQQSLQISAARNEFESFQVHAFANANPIQMMNVTVSDFTNAQTGDVIPSATNVFVY